MDKSLIINKIKEYYNFKNDTDFADFLGVKRSTLSMWKSRNTIDYDVIANKCVDIDANWLLTGNGDMLKSRSNDSFKITPLKNNLTKNIEQQEVPLFDVSASAGIQSIFLNPNQLIPLEYIKIPNLPKVDGAIRITGDSMYPLLKSGDIIIYKEGYDKDFIVWGEIYLVYVQNAEGEECFAVKYLKKSERNGYIRLVSYNDHHAPQEYPIEYLKKWALVKASIRINSAI